MHSAKRNREIRNISTKGKRDRQNAGFFNDDPQIIAAAADYLRAYAIDVLLTSFLFPFTGYFNGRGKTTFVMIQGFLGAFAVRIPVSFLMSRWEPVSLFHVGLATPSSSLVQILLCFVYFFLLRKKDKALLPEHGKDDIVNI